MAKKLINGILTDDLTGDSGTVAVASIPALAPASGALSSSVAALVPASGLASSPVAVVGPVSDPKLCPRGIDFTLPGSPGVTVDVVEDGSGNLDFTVTVDNASGRNADLSGLFFQFNDQKLATLAVSGDPQITQFVTGDDSVINLKNGVNMNGAGVTAFDVGIEFGKAGIGSDHQNIQTTSFVLSDSAHDLTTDDFHQAGETSTVGVRTLSVGQKLVGDAPFAPTANPDSVTTLEDVPITIPISALATDPNPGATLAIHEIGMGPQFGTVTIAPDGQSLTYTPTNLDYMVNGVLTGNQDSFQYCVEDSLGGMDSNTITVADTPVADPPTVSVKVLAPEAGDPATLTRLLVTATSGDFGTAAAGSDFIKNLGLNLSGDVISGVALSDIDGLLNPITGTITTIGQSGLFTDEIDITAPSNQSINDNLTITANNDETEGFGSPVEASASTSQPIVIDFSQDLQTQDFQAVNQSIWTTGTAFTTDFNRFLGINTSIGGPVSFGIGVASVSASATVSLKTGFQANLHIDSGSFNADLPFDVTLDSTFNKTTDTLTIDPTETALSGGQISSTGPNGNLELDFIFNAMAKYSAKATALGTTLASTHGTLGPFATNLNIVKLNSSKLSTTIPIPPGDPIASLSFAWPTLNTTPTSSGPGMASSAGTSNPIANFNLDLVALALAALGINPDPLDFSVAGLNVDLLSLNAGFDVDTQQQLNLSALGLKPTLTLEDGTVEPFTFGTPLTITDALSHDTNKDGALNLSLNLTPDASLQNVTGLAGALSFGLTVGKFDFEGAGGALFDQSVNVPLGSVPLFKNTFGVNFQPKTEHVTVG